MLRSLRCYLWAQSHRYYTIDHLEERGIERGSALQTSWKGWEVAIINQTSLGLPMGTKSYILWLPGGERHGKRKCSTNALKRWKDSIINQTDTGTVSKASLGKVVRDGMELIGLSWAHWQRLQRKWALIWGNESYLNLLMHKAVNMGMIMIYVAEDAQ